MKDDGFVFDKSAEALRAFGDLIQRRLFPAAEEELGPLDAREREFVRLCAVARPFFPDGDFAWVGNGKPPVPRWNYFKAFLAKAVWDFGPTSALIGELRTRPTLRRLCGFGRVPSEGEFSRVFAAFARRGTAQGVFAAFTAKSFKGAVIHNLSIDSMAVHARESVDPARLAETRAAKALACAVHKSEGAAARERPPSRLAEQPRRGADENLRDLPALCDVGAKRNSKGFKETWRGYKLHVAAADGDIPVAFWLTSASLHDSQAAIPLIQKAAEVCPSLYHLMDAAYDAAPIRDYSRSVGSVPIIPANPRRLGSGNAPELEPDRAERFRKRSGVERVNSHLEDGHGGRSVYVRGHAKVSLHLAFGMLAVAVEQMTRLIE